MTKTDGGPAFPTTEQYFPPNTAYEHFSGMTLRDWFAGHALAGMMATADKALPGKLNEDFARAAYGIADAMLAERERGRE